MMPEFSIIIPVFNVETYISECLKSIDRQTYTDYELILVDDGSTDRSGEICDKYGDEHQNVQVIHKRNGGLSEARNTGISLATGKYILFVDSDDYVEKTTLEVIHNIVGDKEPDIIATCYNFVVLADGEISRYPEKQFDAPANMISGTAYINAMASRKMLQCCAQYYIFSRRFIQKNDLSFEKGIYHEDELWTIEGLVQAKKVLVSDKPFYYHRMREGSITHQKNKERNAKDIIYICEKLDKSLPTGEQYSWARDRVATLYMSGTFVGGTDFMNKEKIDRRLPIRNAKSIRNRVKAAIFFCSPRGYVTIDKMLKG